MTLWLFRGGRNGEHEELFLEESRVGFHGGWIDVDLSKLADRSLLVDRLRELEPDASDNRLSNHAGQIWPIAHSMKIGDWIVTPSKRNPVIMFAEITGEYEFRAGPPNPLTHSRRVRWFATDVPRTAFDQDILYSFGAFMTVCRIQRNNAEERVKEMARNSWKAPLVPGQAGTGGGADGGASDLSAPSDLALLGRDEIADLITRKFQGHELTRLVEAVLQAQGYSTFRSPEGPDRGVDILAGSPPLGFGSPTIAVQVKSGDISVDRPTLDQLLGAMQNFKATHGLLVSWSGFKKSMNPEKPQQFFRVRMWNRDHLIDELLRHYNDIGDQLRAEIPLKRIWVVARPDAESSGGE